MATALIRTAKGAVCLWGSRSRPSIPRPCQGTPRLLSPALGAAKQSLRLVRAWSAAQAPESAPAYDEAGSSQADLECGVVFIKTNNSASDKYSLLIIECKAYRGLLKTVCWTLNGLDIRAANSYYLRTDDGFARFELQLTSLKSRKLSDALLDEVAARIQELIVICQAPGDQAPDEWVLGNVEVSNRAHAQYTTILIKGEPAKPGYLLELSSVLNGIGTMLHEAIIQGDPEYEHRAAPLGHNFARDGRAFQFHVTDADGHKLSASRVASVLYTLDLVAGRGYMPTVPPNPAALAKHKVD